MTALLPGFQDQLEARATELATGTDPRRSRRRRRRLHGRGLVVVVVAGVLGAGGVAYAAKSLWSPQLGNPISSADEQPTASRSSVPAQQLALLGVLRRPQTAEDRGAGTRAALTFQPKEMAGLRVDAVRRLGTTPSGGAVVLLPVEKLKSMDPGYVEDRADALCLWMGMSQDEGGGGGQGCSSVADLRAGRMKTESTGPPPAEQRRRRLRAEAEQRKMAAEARRQRLTMAEYANKLNRETMKKNGGRTYARIAAEDMSDWQTTAVQVVPDGVAKVRYRDAGKVVIAPVVDNLAIAFVKRSRGRGIGLAWLDAEGRELYQGKRFPQRKPADRG